MAENSDDWLLQAAGQPVPNVVLESDNQLETEIKAEAERVFKGSAINVITELVSSYSIASSYE